MASDTSRKVPFHKNLFYRAVRLTSRLIGVTVFDLRCLGREHLCFDGPALILCTHQSHFDPVLVGLINNDRLNYLARRTLFKNRAFGALISLLDAIELDRDRSGIAGLKETMKRLKRGERVLVFPEGTRTSDGKIAPLRPGFISVARRCRVPLIPIAITGAFEVLPRSSTVPRCSPISMAVGPRINEQIVADLNDEELLTMLRARLIELYQQARAVRPQLAGAEQVKH